MSSSGLELTTFATTPTAVAFAARLQRLQSSNSPFTEHRPASVPSTNEASRLLADPNVRFAPSISSIERRLTRDKQRGVDQPEPSNASAPTDPPRASTFNQFSELFDITTAQGLLHCLLLLFILSVGVGVVVYDCFMHFGAPTTFSSGNSRKGFTESPNMRGTFNIITACFATILTCVYRSLHLDVTHSKEQEKGEVTDDERNSRQLDIERREGTVHGQDLRWRKGTEKVASWLRKLWIKIQSMRQRAVWVMFNILAPELVAYVAVIELTGARRWRKMMVERFPGRHIIDISKKWTLEHQHMANMGGFKVPSNEGGYVILRSGCDFYHWAYENPAAFSSVDFKQVGMDIEGHSKADGLLKAYTVIQALWLVVQTIERACKGLPVTELEVTTCAYVACAIFTYICWWSKPYGVEHHILLHIAHTPHPHSSQDPNMTPFNRTNGLENDAAGSLELPAVVLSGIIGAGIGAIHCTLWNAQFANTNGQLLWRMCCITQILAPILMSVFLAVPSLRLAFHWEEKWDNKALRFAFIPCFLQFSARIVIFILIGYSFWSQPADVYRVADWSWSWFPHIS